MLWILYWMPQPHTNIKGQEDTAPLKIRKEERKEREKEAWCSLRNAAEALIV